MFFGLGFLVWLENDCENKKITYSIIQVYNHAYTILILINFYSKQYKLYFNASLIKLYYIKFIIFICHYVNNSSIVLNTFYYYF